MRKPIRFSIVPLLLLTAASCGNRGPLQLEPELLPPPVARFTLLQLGHQMKLEWALPDWLSDGKTPLLLESVSRVLVHSTDSLVPLEKFAKKSDLAAKIPLKDLQSTGKRSFTLMIPYKEKDLKGKTYMFAVSYEYGKKRSTLGPVLSIPTMAPYQAVSDLKLTQEKKVVILRWTKPAPPQAEGQKPPVILGYHIYRQIRVNNLSGPAVRLTQTPAAHEYYEDSDTGIEGEYSYTITSALTPQVESEPSSPVTINIVDQFPPEIPKGLVAFSAADHVLLTWKKVQDTDLGHYRIYRKEKEADEFQLLADKITETQFKDFKVKKGVTCYYAISAVDRKGNESEQSSAILHEFQ